MTETGFRGRAVVVTGASSGIGKALALRLADEGAWLALAARDPRRLEALAGECQQRGGRAIAIPTDVADESRCRTLIERTRDEYGHVAMIVNNAGMDVVCRLDELPDLRLFRQVMDVNFYGTVYCTYYALPYLKAIRGRIVNISSLGGMLAIPYNTSYISSKFAVNGFSDSLRMELAGTGVTVTNVCPYWVITEFHERYLDKNGQPRGPAGRAIYTKETMTADQCARIVLKAARQRKRETLLGPGRLAVLLKLIAPGLADRIAVNAVLRPAVRRVSDGRLK